MNRCQYKLKGLHCSECAAKIEREISRLSWVQTAQINFAESILSVYSDKPENRKSIERIVSDIEPDIKLLSVSEDTKSRNLRGFNHEYIELISGAVFALSALLLPLFPTVPTIAKSLCLILSTLVTGYKILLKGVRQTYKLRPDENTLMTIAVIAAMLMGELWEGAMVTLLFKLGELLEDAAVERSRRQIEALTEIRPDKANLFIQNGEFVETDAKNIKAGDRIAIYPFERVPLDCTVINGSSEVDSSALTGESLPQAVSEGSKLLSGMVNQGGLLEAEVTNEYAESAASRIIDMVQSAAAQKASTERMIAKFARWYTIVVVALAVLLTLIPPLLGLGSLSKWLSRSLVFLVASCPCSLVISVPLGFFAAIGGASKQGILIKGGKYLEAIAGVKAIAFDKTGTLTDGALTVQNIETAGRFTRNELMTFAASAERFSTHPIAQAIIKSNEEVNMIPCKNYIERPGLGVTCESEDGHHILVGRRELLDWINLENCPQGDVYIAVDGCAEGSIKLSDTVRKTTPDMIKQLTAFGVRRIVMLTGDGEAASHRAANDCGITEVHHSLFPENKMEWMQRLRTETGKVIFVGDGINDAPVLAAADCGIAMGLGSQAAIEAADAVLTSGNLDRLPYAIRLSRRAMSVIRFNIILALICKLAVLILAIPGLAPMWLAIIADVGITILSVLNSSRLLYVKKMQSLS